MTVQDIVILIGAITTALGILATNIINIIIAMRTEKVTKEVAASVNEVHTVVNSKNDLLVKEVSDLKLLVADLRRGKENLAAKNE